MNDHEDDVLSMALEDSGQVTRVPETGLSQLGKLAVELIDKQAELAQLDEAVKRKKAEIEDLEQRQIPSLMSELNMSSFTMVDGSKLTVKPDFAISIKADMRERAFAWLIEHGHEGIIKTSVSVAFGKGEFERAEALMRRIKKSGSYDVDLDRSVHSGTLKAWAKEIRNDQGLPVGERLPEGPDSPFTTFDYSKVKIEAPKAPKARK